MAETEQVRTLAKYMFYGYSINEALKEFGIGRSEIKEELQKLKQEDYELYSKMKNHVYIACCCIVKRDFLFEEAIEKFKLTPQEFWHGLDKILNIDKKLYIQTRNCLYQQNVKKDG